MYFSFKILYGIIKNKFKESRERYKIIPLGSYCFSRIIVTINGMKKTKLEGEKTCPFDMAFYYNFDKIAELIENKFLNFYDNLEYDNNTGHWINKKLNAIFNHDGKLSREEFQKRYNKRIENFYKYINNKAIHKYFLIATEVKISKETLIKLKEVLNKYISTDNFDIIYINQNKEKIDFNIKNIHIIDQSYNVETFLKMNSKGDWAKKLKGLQTKEARQIYNDITKELKKIIK